MRICLVYDCLFPWTHGGAERWYRSLADEFVAAGHEVKYLTRRQWDGPTPDIPSVDVVAVSPGGNLYDRAGRRRVGPPVRFGLGCLRYLARHRDRFDVVHCCSFPYFSLLAARTALAGSGTVVGVDWFEAWSRAYWREYLGPVGGRVGAVVQSVCARVTPMAFVYSELTAARLRQGGVRQLHMLEGLYSGPLITKPAITPPPRPEVIYVGRHIPEKRVDKLPAAIASAQLRLPDLCATIFGDGPETGRVSAEISRLRLERTVNLAGFVGQERIEAAMRSATCLVLPSSREGYGLVVVEAAAMGTPVVVVDGPDNAAVGLIEPGVNGFVAPSPRPQDLADAVVQVHEGGSALRKTTAEWFSTNAHRLSARGSAQQIIAAYESAVRHRRS